MGPTQPPTNEADYSLPSNAKVNVWSCTSTLLYVFMMLCLVEHGDVTFTLTSAFIITLSCLMHQLENKQTVKLEKQISRKW